MGSSEIKQRRNKGQRKVNFFQKIKKKHLEFLIIMIFLQYTYSFFRENNSMPSSITHIDYHQSITCFKFKFQFGLLQLCKAFQTFGCLVSVKKVPFLLTNHVNYSQNRSTMLCVTLNPKPVNQHLIWDLRYQKEVKLPPCLIAGVHASYQLMGWWKLLPLCSLVIYKNSKQFNLLEKKIV